MKTLAQFLLPAFAMIPNALMAQEKFTVLSQMPPPVLRIDPAAGMQRIQVDGQMFAEYRFESQQQPTMILGAGPGEARYGSSQRSLWFSHGNVNGVDFVHGKDGARIEHLRFVPNKEKQSIHSQNVWLDGEGEAVCLDERRVRFQVVGELRWIDYEVTLFASEGPVTFGDCEDAGLGLRLAPISQSGDVGTKGALVNSEDQRGDEVQGRRASWIDHSTSQAGRRIGIAVFDHPRNLRHPTWWHTTPDGLRVANPFGAHELGGEREGAGELRLAKGEKATFRYRILIHPGSASEAGLEDQFEIFASTR
ncbi:MAG: DUF6807 domain-containing protein [Planctomycetota bacterium]